jgi:uncharacterized membrane protein YdjX (TVP38/TMEM64 family)
MRYRAALVPLLGLVAVMCLWLFATHRGTLFVSIRDAGPWSPAIYVLCYVILAVAFVPATLLTMLGGALFGATSGGGLAFLAESCAACAAFLGARYIARAPVEQWVSGSPRLACIVNCVARDGRRVVFLLRLSPMIPFSLVNVSTGVSGMRFFDFAVACIGMLPATLMYGYFGSVVGGVVAHGAAGRAHYALALMGLVATMAVTVIVSRIARRELSQLKEAVPESQING